MAAMIISGLHVYFSIMSASSSIEKSAASSYHNLCNGANDDVQFLCSYQISSSHGNISILPQDTLNNTNFGHVSRSSRWTAAAARQPDKYNREEKKFSIM